MEVVVLESGSWNVWLRKEVTLKSWCVLRQKDRMDTITKKTDTKERVCAKVN